MFRHPIISKAINTQWFSNRHSEGVTFHMYFNPIAIPTLALVITAVRVNTLSLVHHDSPSLQVENCIDEWATGRFKAIDFSEKLYNDIYQDHRMNLENWKAHLRGRSILPRMQEHLHEKGR